MTPMTSNDDTLDSSLLAVHIGVWRILMEKRSPFRLLGKETLTQWWIQLCAAYRYLGSFLKDIYTLLGLNFFLLHVLIHIWTGLASALDLYYSSRLLKLIETGFTSGKPDRFEICFALAMKLILVVWGAFVGWLLSDLEPTMKRRIKRHFQEQLMEAHLRLDLPTSKENSSESTVEAGHAWTAFEEILSAIDLAFSIMSQLAFLASVVRGQDGGLFFAGLCVVKPVFSMFALRDIPAFIAHSVNENHRRLLALYSMGTDKIYKQEVLSGSTEKYITQEYHKSQMALGDISDEPPSSLYCAEPNPLKNMISAFLGDLPLAYYALSSLFHPEIFSVASLAMFHQTSTSLRYTFDAISQKKSAFSENFGHIRELHDCLKIRNMNPDGYLPYPKINSAEDAKEGMRVEFRDVTFKYPSSERLALKNVSFTLSSSSLVVIVGSNGSGKSSIVKLLSNLYHPTSGSILIDDIPIESYLGTDLRRSTALLTQNHMLFPLNASENIGIGDPEAAHDINRIKEAAKLGGAYEFVEKLSKGWDENLDIVWTRWASQYPMYPGPLKENLDKVEKRIEISGGEAQRLAASRAFMRVMSGKMKLLIVDEPTSAMDPEGEFQLLERLREMRLGKTVVFVTHRFGHLTKHADLILCMKDGELIESGTHQALMEKKSEYFKLYSIQALAFADDQPKSTSPNLVGPIL